MKSILEHTYDLMKEKGSQTFAQIWKHIFSVMKPKWKLDYPDKNLDQIQDLKKGEIYTLLTIDGRFTKTSDDKWDIVDSYTYKDIKKMRLDASTTGNDEEI